ncbi:hypothetical protein CYY_000284 [Polysphondylium violaceum]|uniref:Uncharacterized protein n=1 Tax=Polysphondylium violaceum TaxID=133409 RepID=A0A8J4Q4Z9_9MYCE|nr:hypothetical protein CYY_000284 [Polysphondylium violaceum]
MNETTTTVFLSKFIWKKVIYFCLLGLDDTPKGGRLITKFSKDSKNILIKKDWILSLCCVSKLYFNITKDILNTLPFPNLSITLKKQQQPPPQHQNGNDDCLYSLFQHNKIPLHLNYTTTTLDDLNHIKGYFNQVVSFSADLRPLSEKGIDFNPFTNVQYMYIHPFDLTYQAVFRIMISALKPTLREIDIIMTDLDLKDPQGLLSFIETLDELDDLHIKWTIHSHLQSIKNLFNADDTETLTNVKLDVFHRYLSLNTTIQTQRYYLDNEFIQEIKDYATRLQRLNQQQTSIIKEYNNLFDRYK